MKTLKLIIMSLFNFRNISRLFNEHLRQMISFSKK